MRPAWESLLFPTARHWMSANVFLTREECGEIGFYIARYFRFSLFRLRHEKWVSRKINPHKSLSFKIKCLPLHRFFNK